MWIIFVLNVSKTCHISVHLSYASKMSSNVIENSATLVGKVVNVLNDTLLQARNATTTETGFFSLQNIGIAIG